MNEIDTSKKELFELLEIITEQTEMLKLHKGEIPQLYIDLLKKNVLKFYESINLIDQIKHLDENLTIAEETQAKVVKQEITNEIPVPTTKLPEEKKLIEAQEVKADKTENIKPPISEIIEEVVEKIPDQIKEEIPESPKAEAKTEPINETKEEKPALTFSLNPSSEHPQEKEIFIHPNSDLFTEPKPSVADKLATKVDPSFGEKMQQNQINDIKSAIGINDKFLFINELFEGDLKNYNQAIDQLNLANNKDEALSSFTSFKEKFKWIEKDEAVIKLKTILNRKFSNS